MEKHSDAELVQAAIAGDKNAYGELYDRYAPLVRAICYDRTRHLADAQDLAQDVFVRAYERLSQLRQPDRFGPWTVSIARHRCQEWRRQRMRQQQGQARFETSVSAVSEPSDDAALEALWKTMAQLPEQERLALHVFYLQGNSTDDSCRIVGLSRSGFYRALDRARKQLRRRLAGELEEIS